MKFNGSKYLTQGVQADIPTAIQIAMWNMIEAKLQESGRELDYLQVFNLSSLVEDGRKYQRIEHNQEVPKFKYSIKLELDSPVTSKVFVIDDKTHVTMLLAQEY